MTSMHMYYKEVAVNTQCAFSLMDWLTCVNIVQLKEFRQAVEDRHTHLYQNRIILQLLRAAGATVSVGAGMHHFIWNSFRRHAFVCTYMFVVHLHVHTYVPLSMKPCIKGSQCIVKYVRMCYKVLYVNNF